MKLSKAIENFESDRQAFVIGEIKARSPRDGDLLRKRKPEKLAQEMIAGGAEAISVVTEPEHFGGEKGLIKEVKKSVNVPLLAKDFVKKREQIEEARSHGADAILLITSMVDEKKLSELYSACIDLEIEPLVETHTPSEIERANALGAELIGINNRDITRLELDSGNVERTERLIELVRDEAIVVSESSIYTREDVQRAIQAGAAAVLVGTSILKSDDLKEKVREIRNYGNGQNLRNLQRERR